MLYSFRLPVGIPSLITSTSNSAIPRNHADPGYSIKQLASGTRVYKARCAQEGHVRSGLPYHHACSSDLVYSTKSEHVSASIKSLNRKHSWNGGKCHEMKSVFCRDSGIGMWSQIRILNHRHAYPQNLVHRPVQYWPFWWQANLNDNRNGMAKRRMSTPDQQAL